jgi:anti-anti-sigma regulatory factor/two-component sensor histidine kinase
LVEEENSSPISENEVLSRLASVGQIAAGVAHEVRNPLTSVKGLLQLMKEEYDHQYWDVIFPELDQAITTIQSLLAVSKPSLHNEPSTDFSLSVELENILSLFQHDMYRIEFIKEWHDKSAKVRGKRNQIKQALFNIVKNSCEAIPGTGRVTLSHYRVGDRVHLVLSDTGVGISEEHLSRLGVPFFTTKADGVGMGLTQVYSTLYEHGATIDVKSAPGAGTTFTITMPVSPSQKHTDSPGGVPVSTISDLHPTEDVREFFRVNRKKFNEWLEQEARTTFEMVSKSKFVSKQDLIDHANQITELIHDGLTQDIIELAQERGKAWAKSDIPIISKMEWFYALRKITWRFLQAFYNDKGLDAAQVFTIADVTSDALDNFIVHFNVSFAKYREDVLKSQQAVIEALSVPIIPLFDGIAVLPIIGTLDADRLTMIEQRLLEQLEHKNFRRVFIDLSGALVTDELALDAFERIIDGVMLLGCEAVLTGIGARLARFLLNSHRDLVHRVTVESSLQAALLPYTESQGARNP